jgi:DNA-binding CsgD family transcriptional regulator
VADERGFLREVHPSFVHVIRKQWPHWQGSRLPEALHVAVRDAQPMRIGKKQVSIERKGCFRFLQVLAIHPLDSLSVREREVAQRYAHGATYADIAVAMSISSATVRNHISHCFRKLAVNNKAELAKRIFNL